jgi:hypothetical protein
MPVQQYSVIYMQKLSEICIEYYNISIQVKAQKSRDWWIEESIYFTTLAILN